MLKLLILLLSSVCSLLVHDPTRLQAAQQQKQVAKVVTVGVDKHIVTTGIAGILAEAFYADTGISVTWVPMLKNDMKEYAVRCEADAIIMSRPAAEEELMEKGVTQDWRPLMYNKLLLVGHKKLVPIMSRQSVIASLGTIVKKKIHFVGRGENSDNMNAEQFYWQLLKITPYETSWYLRLEQPSDANAMALATEKEGTTIVSQLSWDEYKKNNAATDNPLTILTDDDPLLMIQHNIMTISEKFCPNINYAQATTFVAWMTSKKAQNIIREFSYQGEDAFSPALAY